MRIATCDWLLATGCQKMRSILSFAKVSQWCVAMFSIFNVALLSWRSDLLFILSNPSLTARSARLHLPTEQATQRFGGRGTCQSLTLSTIQVLAVT